MVLPRRIPSDIHSSIQLKSTSTHFFSTAWQWEVMWRWLSALADLLPWFHCFYFAAQDTVPRDAMTAWQLISAKRTTSLSSPILSVTIPLFDLPWHQHPTNSPESWYNSALSYPPKSDGSCSATLVSWRDLWIDLRSSWTGRRGTAGRKGRPDKVGGIPHLWELGSPS